MDELTPLTTEQRKQLEDEQTRLTKIIEALVKLDKSKEWHVLKELVFDKSVKIIETQLLNETLAADVKLEKIHRLQGEWAWAKQYSDVNRFVDQLKKQLEAIKLRI